MKLEEGVKRHMEVTPLAITFPDQIDGVVPAMIFAVEGGQGSSALLI